MSDILERADLRQQEATALLEHLDLMRRWSRVGEPFLEGAAANGLIVKPDIDIEVWCDEPNVASVMSVLTDCAHVKGVWRVWFQNHLTKETPFPDNLRALDWGIYCLFLGTNWAIDGKVFQKGEPGLHGKDLVEPLRRALTPEFRRRILTIKEELIERGESLGGIYIYEAVIDHGINTLDDFSRGRRGRVESPTGFRVARTRGLQVEYRNPFERKRYLWRQSR